MSDKDNGLPAFPITAGNQVYAQGMTLRDWFAGQALAGLMADPDMNADPKPVARVCYNYADAMLKARGK